MKEGRLRNQAFITFRSDDESPSDGTRMAQKALHVVHGFSLKGKPLVIVWITLFFAPLLVLTCPSTEEKKECHKTQPHTGIRQRCSEMTALSEKMLLICQPTTTERKMLLLRLRRVGCLVFGSWGLCSSFSQLAASENPETSVQLVRMEGRY